MRREIWRVCKSARLRKQIGRRRDDLVGANQFVNLPAWPDLHHVKLVASVHTKRCQTSVAETSGKIAQVRHGWRCVAVQRQRVDSSAAVVAKNIFAAQLRGVVAATINVAAD